jgi:hypothetical protein
VSNAGVPIRQTRDITQESERLWVMQIIQAAQSRKLYGSITLKFENGGVVRVVKEENLLPPRGGEQKATS